MTISIVGTGYVGLVTGAVFADFGNTVYCIDIAKEKIDSLKHGHVPFFEPGLEDLVKKNIDQKRLFFTTNYADAIPDSEIVFICVGTPPEQNGDADLSYVNSAILETAKHIKKETLIVIKSTVPVGADEQFEKLINDKLRDKVEFASNPEFLKEGSALQDALHPDRIVIGAKNQKYADALVKLYQPFGSNIIICDLRSAQLIKYVANTFLATKISFANLVANLCEKVGADVESVLQGASLDKRIGRAFLYPGVGYGGSCFPKDVSAFISTFKKSGLDPQFFEEIEKINKLQVDLFVKKIDQAVGGVSNKIITILGLSFKPNTDDLRHAPSLAIIKKLVALGAKIKTYDPVAMVGARALLGEQNIVYAKDAYSALEQAEALALVTEWNEFKELDLKKVKQIMKNPVIVDGRNIFEPKLVKALGFRYSGIGRS